MMRAYWATSCKGEASRVCLRSLKLLESGQAGAADAHDASLLGHKLQRRGQPGAMMEPQVAGEWMMRAYWATSCKGEASRVLLWSLRLRGVASRVLPMLMMRALGHKLQRRGQPGARMEGVARRVLLMLMERPAGCAYGASGCRGVARRVLLMLMMRAYWATSCKGEASRVRVWSRKLPGSGQAGAADAHDASLLGHKLQRRGQPGARMEPQVAGEWPGGCC